MARQARRATRQVHGLLLVDFAHQSNYILSILLYFEVERKAPDVEIPSALFERFSFRPRLGKSGSQGIPIPSGSRSTVCSKNFIPAAGTH